jgi:transcriptional regulator with AAA-type ATPase domain
MNDLRWRSWAPFQRASEPIFVLNRYRRIVFVNRAWEQLTGLPLVEARQIICRPRRHTSDVWEELLGQLLRPPDEVLDGQPGHTRKVVPRFDPARRGWDIDFLPFRSDDGLLFILGRITTSAALATAGPAALPESTLALRDVVLRRHILAALTSDLPAMRRVTEQVRLAARVRVPALIVGERGTGKQWIARTIHALGESPRRPFVALDCARLPSTALTGVLFGEGEYAGIRDIGTLYLREPSRLPRELQQRLATLLASAVEGHGPRILAGLRLNPDDELRAGRLLDELASRLGTLTIALPPLRERREDLPRLVEGLLERAKAAADRPVTTLTPAAQDLLRTYPWPGNTAELYAVLVGACGRAAGERIDSDDLPLFLRLGSGRPGVERPLPLKELLETAERRLIELALRRAGGNKSRAAELLAVWRPLLLRRMSALGIADPTPRRKPPAEPEGSA